MDNPILKKLEAYRKREHLSILRLCREMGIYNDTYHRWKRTGSISGVYKKVILDFLAQKSSYKLSQESTSPALNSDIAVIGIGCYYPGASNVRELWENILSRRVQFRRMLDQRLPLADYYNEDSKFPDKTYLTKAAFLENFQFDWGRLRIPKKTVESTDIAHWLALDIALKTFEDAGYKLGEIPIQNTGVIVGNTLTGEQTRSQTLRLRWPYFRKVFNTTAVHLGMGIEERGRFDVEMEKIYKSAFYPITEDSLAGGLANTIAGRICNYLNLKGGGYIVDGACSSSLLAVATAADALKMGNMDLALAGGVDISLDPFELVGFAKAGALARDKMSVYDQSANGFLPGEGCGFVLLKRLNDAIRDKNYIYAVIKGWGISSDGKGGIMEPSSSGQSFAIGRAYKNLEYKISDVDFVEGHGTGTAKGDKVELEGIAAAIQQALPKNHKGVHSCGVTSFKSIVGHTKAAAGVGGLIKAILAVNQRIMPPTASCVTPNEVFKDKARNLYPLIQGQVLSPTKVARAGISSAGFGGINCHMTVESKDEPKLELKPNIDERALFVSQQQTEIFVFSSRSTLYLKKIIQKFKEDLRNISIAEMADLAALLNKKAGKRLPVKVAIVTDSPEHLYEALVLLEGEIDTVRLDEGQVHKVSTKDPNTYIIFSNAAKKSRIGFLYPGQGSQRINMTRVLVERYAWARDLFSLSKLPLQEYIYKATDKYITKEELQEFEKKLTDTKITQPAIILSSLIWTEFLSKLGIEANCVTGHSLGELIAFWKAGTFSKETLVKFAELRGSLMAQKGTANGSMAGLLCSRQKAQELISGISGNIIIANINSYNQIVVSGGGKEIGKVIELAIKEGITARRLNVSNAFHSSLMTNASNKIKTSQILPDSFSPNSVGVFSCMEGILLDKKVDLKEYFSRQVISPVNFVGSVEAISKECDVLIEVGPGRVLTDLAKAINKENGPVCLSVESIPQNDRDLNIVLAELFVRNVPIQWEQLYQNRLIKDFVRASKKKFIENQCERPLRLNNQILKIENLKTQYQEEEPKSQPEEIIPGGLQGIEGKDNIANLLVDLTYKLTSFDKQSITLESRLLDDLNLDSIKAAELIGQAARTLGIAGQVDPSKLSNNTLGEIRNRLFDLTKEKSAAGAQGGGESVFKRYQEKTWVRNFILDLKPEEITTRNVNQLKNLKNIVIMSEKEEEILSQRIGREFTKVKVQQFNFGEKPKLLKDKTIDCLVAVLPKGQVGKEFSLDTLKEIITRAHQVVDIATSKRLHNDSFVVLVSFGGGDFGENRDLRNIASCCMKSLVSTLYLEYPNLKVRVLDFNALSSESEISSKIVDELQTYEPFSVVGYDAQLIRKVVYYENSQPANYSKRGITWSKDDVVLITGGAKGITAQCALELARSIKARMVLVGRSPVPKKTDENNEILQTLEKFEKEGIKANYYQCDVTNPKEVVEVIGEIERKVGKITGFVHGAGINSLKRLKQFSLDEAFKESLPKIMGAVNVCNVLKDYPPKLIVGITSIIGLTGMEGSGWYGLTNEVLNLYLHQFKNQSPKTEVVAIAYSVWDEVGMGTKLGSIAKLAEKGIGAIPIEQGVARFKHLIESSPGVQQVIVAARVAGIDTFQFPKLKTDGFRFIEKAEYFLPKVELIAQAQLNIKNDPYLLDHNWKGSLLFPFVFGLEAMTQAVACVLGVEKFDKLKVKDIKLDRPVNVPEETGTYIEVHAEVLEQKGKGSLQDVKVEIYSQESAYLEPHFSAVFEINPKFEVPISGDLAQKSKETIDLDMKTDIYGPILFQGKMFQCIEQIHELFYDEKAQKAEILITSAYKKSTEEFLKNNKKFNNRLMISDPFFVDTMFQSMQIMIPQDLSLPRDIEEIEIDFVSNKSNKKYFIQSTIKKADVDYYKASAMVCDGAFIIRIKNCRLKIIENILDNPSANDLVNSTQRDQRIIEERILELSRQFDFSTPVIKCQYCSGLNKLNKVERHQVEYPLMVTTGNEVMKKLNRNIVIKVGNIDWSPSGKPALKGKELEDIGVSLSHNNNLMLCMAGLGDQGCDIELVNKISKEEWDSIIDKKYQEILDQLIIVLGDMNLSGTVIWSAIEVIKKINHESTDLSIEHIKEDLVILKDGKSQNGFILITPIKLTNFKNRVIAFYQEGLIFKKDENDLNKETEKRLFLKKFGFNEDDFGIQVDYSGPQEQYVFTKQFPVTFKTNKLLSRRVYFTNYFDWMGELREYSIYPIMESLADMFETGGWGLATNSVKLEILGDLRGNDVVTGRVWMEEVRDQKENIFDICFEWRKRRSQNQFERVAFCKQRTSWIKITGHGTGVIDNLPDSIKNFMDSMRPRNRERKPLERLPEPFRFLSRGKEVKNFGLKRKLLKNYNFDTSLENSNLVGNIYFSNYAKWLGIVGDLYFYDIIPNYYKGTAVDGEFLCLDCEIDYLSEAMPFDKVITKMYLKEIYQNRLDLDFEFFLSQNGKATKKLAVARQGIMWVKRDKKQINAINMPAEIFKKLLE